LAGRAIQKFAFTELTYDCTAKTLFTAKAATLALAGSARESAKEV
jgi:hypothetical protein